MTRRFYQVKMKDPACGPNEIHRPHVVSADLDGKPQMVYNHAGVDDDFPLLGCQAGRNEDLAEALNKTYAPLRVTSIEEFVFGVVGFSRADVLRHLIEIGSFQDPLNVSYDELMEDDDLVSLNSVLPQKAARTLEIFMLRYALEICKYVHKKGLKVQAYTLDMPFAEAGNLAHPAYPNTFLPQFLHNSFPVDLSGEQQLLAERVGEAADAAYDRVFGAIARQKDALRTPASQQNGWLH
jgi:hypothetical protein